MSLVYTSPTSRHNLYLGGKADAKSLPTLQQRNIRRILNVTPAKEQGITAGIPNYFENAVGSKIKYKRIPVYDASTSDLLSYADEMVEFISQGLHHGGVLVHCQRGVSRSATAVVMFLMRRANMTMKQSLKLCQRRRPVVDPIPAFLDQLMAYEKDCRKGGHLTANDAPENNNEVEKVSRGNGIRENSGAQKRTTDDIIDGDEKKRRVAGPAIGPSMAPARGPIISASIGPARGPPEKESSAK